MTESKDPNKRAATAAAKAAPPTKEPAAKPASRTASAAKTPAASKVAVAKATAKVGKISKNVKTDKNGYAKFKVDLKPGTYKRRQIGRASCRERV